MAEQIERNGARFYRKAGEVVEDQRVAEFLIALAAWEDGHERALPVASGPSCRIRISRLSLRVETDATMVKVATTLFLQTDLGELGKILDKFG